MNATRMAQITHEQVLDHDWQGFTTDLGEFQTEKDAINAGMMKRFGTTKLREIKTPVYGKGRYFARIRVHHAITFNLDCWGRIYFQRKHT